MKKNRLLFGLVFGWFCMVAVSSDAMAKSALETVKIEQTIEDVCVIPDKYNTGCNGNLTKVVMDAENGTTINGVLFIAGSNATRHVLDFYYRNKEISGTVTIENCDFSDYSLWVYNTEKVDREIHVVFNNCNFSGVSTARNIGKVSFTFNHCTFRNFNGGNSTFNKCQFGKSYSDGMVPFQNVHVNDCFFTDMGSIAATGKEIHTDGVQIYGYKDVDVLDVSYTNCRFEIPPVSPAGSTAYINACIMLQLEFANAKDVLFRDCIVNGGGYSIYAESKYEGLTFDNVVFQGIRFGAAKKYGVFYPKIDPAISIKDISGTDNLYIGSVWKEAGETHLSVTNDTNQERTLQIYTDTSQYTYTIPACPLGSEMADAITYADLPFDVDIVLPQDCRYVVCYDTTINGYGRQIRFMNWSEEEVYFESDLIYGLTACGDDILLEGSCGKTVKFTLTKSGVLTLTGTGSTESYHSQKFPAWSDYTEYIKEIRVEEGIEGLGGMIFRNCTGVKVVSLPESLTSIGQRAFGGCVSLKELILPANVKEIGKAVFSGTVLQEIYYSGNDWDSVVVATDNDNLAHKVVYYQNGQVLYRIRYVLNGSEDAIVTHENPGTYAKGSEFLLSIPVRNGYIFEGWYLDEGFSKKIEGITKADYGNKTIYAKWSPVPAVQQPIDTDRENATVDSKAENSEKVILKKIKGLKIKKLKKKRVQISWKRDKSATGYQIAIRIGTKGKYKIVKNIKRNQITRYIKKNIKKGKGYYVKVRAYKSMDSKKVYGKYSAVKKIRMK